MPVRGGGAHHRTAAGFRVATQSRIQALRAGVRRRKSLSPIRLSQRGNVHPGPPGHRESPGLLRHRRRIAGAPFPRHAARPRGGAGERAHRQSHAGPAPGTAAARQALLELEAAERAERKARFGRTRATADLFDLVVNSEALGAEQIAEIVETAVNSAHLRELGYLSGAAEAQLQFQMRLKLSRYGMVPPAKITLRKKMFANPSEEMFANLLDFYRIAWEYEPRSFPIQYDRDGHAAGSLHPRFLSAGVRSIRGTDHHEAVAGHQEEPQGAAAARAVSARQYSGVLSEGFREPDLQVRAWPNGR